VLDRLKSLLRGGAACRQSHAGSHGRSVHL
jgi:hypothetical protein